MISKMKYCKRFIIWTMVATFVIVGIIGLLFGTVIEANLFEEIAKWVVMGIGISGITGMFAYILSPLFWHIKYDDKVDPKDQSM